MQRIHAVLFHQGARQLGEEKLRTGEGVAALRAIAAAQLSPAGQLQVATALDMLAVLEGHLEVLRRRLLEAARQLAGAAQAVKILQGKAAQVAAGIRRRATTFGYSPAEREGANACADYLTAKKPYLDYATALANGWPIATGVIEGACRHLVKDRMDITGARWGLDGAEAILKLRALISNGDFDQYWRFHLRKEHERIHNAQYRESVILAA